LHNFRKTFGGARTGREVTCGFHAESVTGHHPSVPHHSLLVPIFCGHAHPPHHDTERGPSYKKGDIWHAEVAKASWLVPPSPLLRDLVVDVKSPRVVFGAEKHR
jgi:hypothetical protein